MFLTEINIMKGKLHDFRMDNERLNNQVFIANKEVEKGIKCISKKHRMINTLKLLCT